MKTTEIRNTFIEFFKERGHEHVPSSSLVPANDPTLLFVNSGMVQFKDVFLGSERRPYKRAATAQRCVRAGGKHNDLENVGYTARHHTFFEMLGNFSFGDYFKREAIQYAWELLTEIMNLPTDRLWVTVYEEDDEAADIWLKEIGVSPDRFARIGMHDNFWSMGDTGPCGPCSEVFYDHGPGVAGGPPGSDDADADRYVEIWNLVFMQFNRDANGNMDSLPKPSVDTGMGLERIAAVLQGVHSTYDIDLFQHLMEAAAEIAGTTDTNNNSLRVIADHIRACAFLVADGVMPANEGRGYVLRRIIRRAARHGYELGLRDPFFYKLIGPLDAEMGAAYSELTKARGQVERVLKHEEERFAETLAQGMRILDESLAKLAGKVLPGETVFKLYDTYGFPVDLTADYALKYEVTLDMEGYERSMAAQRERARAASTFKVSASADAINVKDAEFTGYDTTRGEATVQQILVDQEETDAIRAGQDGVIYLDQTPFYAEAGGQVGDQGWLRTKDGVFVVNDTQKAHAHIGCLEQGEISVGDRVQAEVDAEKRQATVYNHSATHLLHAALKKVLGSHVMQKGSLVEAPRLRFDFSHPEPLTTTELAAIERLVNAEIRANRLAETRIMPLDQALSSGAEALFGEKYDEQVRVVAMGDFSTELCGGTHINRTGDIGLFKIANETGIAAGVRRIEALTAQGAWDYLGAQTDALSEIATALNVGVGEAAQKVQQLNARVRQLEKDLAQAHARIASSVGGDLASQAQRVKGVTLLAAELEGADAKALRSATDGLKNRFGTAVVVLAAGREDKVTLIVGVTKDLTDRLHAGDLAKHLGQQLGGQGGGRPDMGQGGGTDVANINSVLASVAPWISQRLS